MPPDHPPRHYSPHRNTLIRAAAAACLIMANGPLYADDGLRDDLNRVRQIGDDEQRLIAYDSLVDSFLKIQTPQTGNWKISNDTSLMDDKPIIALSLKAESPITGWPDKRHTPSLFIRYKEGKMQAYIATGFSPTVERGDGATVQIRYDSAEAESTQMSKSTDGEALFWEKPENAIRKMASAQRMVFRFTPFNSAPATTTFQLTGLREAVAAIEEASGWRVDDISDIMHDRLSELLLTKDAIVDGRYESPLSTSERMALTIEGNKVRISLDNKWGLLADPGRVCQNVFEKMTRLLNEYPDASFRITAHGSTLTKDDDGKRIISGKQLFDKTRSAALEAELPGRRYTLVHGEDMAPTYWDQDAPKNIRGDLRDSGLAVVVEVTRKMPKPAE